MTIEALQKAQVINNKIDLLSRLHDLLVRHYGEDADYDKIRIFHSEVWDNVESRLSQDAREKTNELKRALYLGFREIVNQEIEKLNEEFRRL